MIGLIMLGSIINYLTRSTLAVAAPTVLQDLHITTQQYSWIVGAFQVAIPIAQRTVTQHFQAICSGVSASTGTPLRFNAAGVGPFWLDRLFVPGQTAQQLSFSWGATGVTARAALVDLMTRSATVLSWRLFCQPSASEQDRFCVLNALPVR